MAIFGNQMPGLGGGSMLGQSPYQSFANRFRSPGLMGGFMPSMSPYQSNIGQQGGMLRYNPMMTPQVEAAQFLAAQRRAMQQQPMQQQPMQQSMQQQQMPQTNAEQIMMNRMLGRQQMQGVGPMTRQDFADLRLQQRKMNPRQNAPRHRRGIYK